MENLWKGVVEAVDVLKAGLSSSVGNGCSTSFWKQKWVTSVPLIELSTLQIPSEIIDATVEDMWDAGSGWKWEVFAEFCTNEVLQTIASYEVVEGLDNEDQFYWSGTSSGSFSIKSAIRIIRNTPCDETENYWKLPWKVWCPQRMRLFLWLLLHDRIMTNSMRTRRGFTEDPFCVSCVDKEETSLHLLRDCSEARKVWSFFPFAKSQQFLNADGIKNWVILNISAKRGEGLETWPSVFAVVVWWLWKWRNCRVFDRTNDIPASPYTFLMQRVWEVLNAKESVDFSMEINAHRYKEIYVRWVAPPFNWIVLNIDGASKGNPGMAGAGGIFRDSSGQIIEAFAERLGNATVTRAELMALRRGLLIAIELNLTNLIIQTDSKVVDDFMKETSPLPAAHCHLVRICRAFVNDRPWTVKVTHIFREANACADWLANHGVVLSQQLVRFDVSNIPNQLFRLSQQDMGGVAWPRVVPCDGF